jgi:hypothetical protein
MARTVMAADAKRAKDVAWEEGAQKPVTHQRRKRLGLALLTGRNQGDPMIITNRPQTGRTTYHRDGTVTVWDCAVECWTRGADLCDSLLATLSEPERARVIRHTTAPIDILRAIRANSSLWTSGDQTYEQFGAEGVRLWALAKTLGMVDAVSDLMHSDIASSQRGLLPNWRGGQGNRTRLPIAHHPVVYHVGTRPGRPGPRRRGRSAFEGHTLSVTTEDAIDDWRRIARPLQGATWELHGPGRFLDYLALSAGTREVLLRGRPDLVTHAPAFWVGHWDYQERDFCGDQCGTWGEAVEAAADHGVDPVVTEVPDDEDDIEEWPGGIVVMSLWEPTAKLRQIAGKHGLDVDEGETSALVEIARDAGLDGIWWDNDFGEWSAPRGGLIHERLPMWRVAKVGRANRGRSR